MASSPHSPRVISSLADASGNDGPVAALPLDASSDSPKHWMRARHVNVILELDLNCNVIWGSRSWGSVIGTNIRELLDKPISEALIGDKDVFQRATDAMLSSNSSYRVRFAIKRGSVPLVPSKLNEYDEKENDHDQHSDPVNIEGVSSQKEAISRSASESADEVPTFEMEGQGITIFDRQSLEPCYVSLFNMFVNKRF